MHDNTGTEGPASLEHVKKSDVFPKKALVSDDERLRVPFPLLSGESAEFLGRTADGVVVLSNFRLLIRYRDSFINVPLGLIESVEIRDIFYLHVYCKDATAVRCSFSTNEACQDWFKRLSAKTAPRGKLDDVFAFAFHAWCVDRNPSTEPVLEGCYQLCPLEKRAAYSFTGEVERLKFDLRSSWRYTEINKSFGLCSSYPSEHIVPKSVTDDHLKKVAGFRALQRFPSIVWRNCRNGAVLVRCSQPEMGFFGWRNTDDENLLSAIPLACALNAGTESMRQQPQDGNSSSSELSSDDSECGVETVEPKKMLIIDCRSYSAAFANRAKGGGVECPEYYQSCEIQFMNLANIHAIRKSFLGLRQLCSGGPDQASWLSGLENTKWLHNMSCLLKAATLVASVNNKEGRPVLVHCSDGWDRTAQIVSLAELLLDPYYRTTQGFQVLIEREWLHFGHKFADRCGNGMQSDDQNERCPVFLQWLECVYQLILQFPCQFQFNEAFLVKLVQHTYSCLFGTFLCNMHQERLIHQVELRTASVWSLLQDSKFSNHLYSPSVDDEVLYPATSVQSLHLWTSVYLSNNLSFASPEEVPTTQPVTTMENGELSNLQKTRSCENLLCLSDHVPPSPSRRKSDPNISMEMGEQQQKLLKDAILGHDGDTSSSESVKSTENSATAENGVASTTDCDQVPSLNINHLHENGHLLNGDIENEGRMCNGESLEGHVLCNGHDVRNGDTSVELDNSPMNGSLQHSDSIQDTWIEGLVNGSTEPTDYQTNTDASKETIFEMSKEVTKLETENVLHTDTEQSNGELYNGTSDSEAGILNNGSLSPNSSTRFLNRTLSNECSCSVETLTDNIDEHANSECRVHEEDSSHTITPSHSQTNGHMYAVESLKCLCDKTSSLHKLKAIEGNTSISTSTSDLTDSRVQLENSLLGKLFSDGGGAVNGAPYNSGHNNLKLRCILAQTGIVNGAPNCGSTNGAIKLVVNGDAFETPPLYPSPISPLSRNSTCPPTPGTSSEGKSIDTPLQKQQTGIGCHLDVDGLTTFKDLVQTQIDRVQSKYEAEISTLRDELSSLRQLLAQHASACNGETSCSLDYKVGVESPGSGDMHSIQSNFSNAASDASWDQMDDPEVKVALWVPDHMVKHCAGCDVEFTVLRRKHHCRNCGKIFCHSCCKDSMPLPHQMVHTPERVCQVCYNKLGSLLTKSVMEFENGISEQPSMAAASN